MAVTSFGTVGARSPTRAPIPCACASARTKIARAARSARRVGRGQNALRDARSWPPRSSLRRFRTVRRHRAARTARTPAPARSRAVPSPASHRRIPAAIRIAWRPYAHVTRTYVLARGTAHVLRAALRARYMPRYVPRYARVTRHALRHVTRADRRTLPHTKAKVAAWACVQQRHAQPRSTTSCLCYSTAARVLAACALRGSYAGITWALRVV